MQKQPFPESLHDIAKMDMKAEGTIKNNNVAQAPLVGENDMTKSQVGDGPSSQFRDAVGIPGKSADQMSGNLMAK